MIAIEFVLEENGLFREYSDRGISRYWQSIENFVIVEINCGIKSMNI